MIDFPKNPVNGQGFVDPIGNLWQYNGTIWTSRTYGDVTELNDLHDYDDTNPQLNDYIAWNDVTGYWEAMPMTRVDYYLRVTFSAAWDGYPYGNQNIHFDTVMYEQGTSGHWDNTSHSYKIPFSGWYECEVNLTSDDGISRVGLGTTGEYWLNYDGNLIADLGDVGMISHLSPVGAGFGSFYHYFGYGQQVGIYQKLSNIGDLQPVQSYFSIKKINI